MKILKINSGVLAESDLRFDASYYLSDGPLTKIKLKKSPYPISTLGRETSDIFKGNIFKRTYVSNSEKGYPFLTASDMMKSDIHSGKFVSRKHTNTANLFVKKGWTLVTRSGTLGNTAYTNKEFENVLPTDDVIRVVPNNKNVLGGYIYAYLSSKYGYGLLIQSGYGGVIQHIEPHHIKDLPIPILPEAKQQEIHDLIVEAADLRVEANELLRGIHETIENNFDIQPLTPNISAISIDRIRKDLRFKSNFFLSTGDKYEEQVRAKKYKDLSIFISNIFTSGREKRTYTKKSNGIPFLSNGDISSYNPFSSCNYMASKNAKSSSIIKENMILTGRVGQDTVGQIYLPYPSIIGTLASDNIIRIVIDNEIDRNYIYAFLSSKIGFEIIRKRKTGVGQPFVTEDMFLDIPILDLDIETKINISDKVKSSLHKKDCSLKKELQAISLIEQEIDSWQQS